MIRQIASLFLVVVCTTAYADPVVPESTPPGEMLLLKNGEVLTGRITRSGDYFVVATADSELQVRIYDAEAICRDLDEAYRHKAAKINPRSVEDHIALAQWCIDRKLFGTATHELIEAHRIDDTHPRIKLLERRLKAAVAEPKPNAPVAVPLTVAGVSEDELDKAARSMAPETMHDFTIRVQPLLVNYCATAGCHGPKAGSSFQLQRVYLNERNDPRLVKQNLHAVLAQLDKQNFASSRLLTVPLSPHGGAKKPLFHSHNADHYRTIVHWAARAISPATAAAPTTRTAATVDPAAGALLQRLPLTPPTNAAAPTDAATTSPAAPASTVSTPTGPPKSAAPPTVPSADPFDPAAFNRRREAAAKP